jgi:ribonuclease BN (tRNA processing enzyme)
VVSAERGLTLDILGAGPAYSDRAGSSGAAYLVRSGGTAVLLDLGQGSFPRLTAAIEPSTLDAVVISHLHPDHFVDLVPLRHYLAYQFHPRRRIRVIAPPGLEARLDGLHAEPGFTALALDLEPHPEDRGRIGELTLESRPVTHTAESRAIRVAPAAGGPGLVYSGDCGRAEDLRPLVRAGDTLLVEVSFGNGPVPTGVNHLDAPAIAALVGTLDVRQVLLTHLQMGFEPGPAVATVTAATGGAVHLVHPGESYRID